MHDTAVQSIIHKWWVIRLTIFTITLHCLSCMDLLYQLGFFCVFFNRWSFLCFTGRNIYKLSKQMFLYQKIPWDNCTRFGSDEANLMTESEKGEKGVHAFMQKNLHQYSCALHIVYTAEENVAGSYPIARGEILIDIFYFFKRSSKRQESLSTCQEQWPNTNGLSK